MNDWTGLLLAAYGFIATLWLVVMVSIWKEGRKDGSTPADQRWAARGALLAPVWPVVMLLMLGPLLVQRLMRGVGGFGQGVGAFMVDATRRKS